MELRIFALLSILLLLVAFVSAQEESPPVKPPPIILGYVTDASGAGISNATVRVENIVATSKMDGSYVLLLGEFEVGDTVHVTAVVGGQEFHQEVTILSPDLNILNFTLPILVEVNASSAAPPQESQAAIASGSAPPQESQAAIASGGAFRGGNTMLFVPIVIIISCAVIFTVIFILRHIKK